MYSCQESSYLDRRLHPEFDFEEPQVLPFTDDEMGLFHDKKKRVRWLLGAVSEMSSTIRQKEMLCRRIKTLLLRKEARYEGIHLEIGPSTIQAGPDQP